MPKYITIVLLLLLAGMACKQSPKLPPEVYVLQNDTALHNINGCWQWHRQNFNGYITEKDKGRLVSQLPVINGKENGIAYGWYSNGAIKYIRQFANGNREGIQKGWYANGKMAYLLQFHNDLYEGVQQAWYVNGQQWQSLAYLHGREEGRQQIWSTSGKLINNFTVKNGKLYGVIGRYNCVSTMQQ